MIPTMLLVGLVLGALVHDRASLERSLLATVVACLLWGVVVGVADGSLATFAGGTVIALANVAVGGAAGAAARRLVGLFRAGRYTRT
jgi:hypothetical protein